MEALRLQLDGSGKSEGLDPSVLDFSVLAWKSGKGSGKLTWHLSAAWKTENFQWREKFLG